MINRVEAFGSAGKVKAGGLLKIGGAVFTIADAVSCPAVGENGNGSETFQDLRGHTGHEVKIVRTIGAGHPEIWICPMAAWFSIGRHGDIVRMSLIHILAGGMGVCSKNDRHIHPAAAFYHIIQRVGAAQPVAAMVKGDPGGIKSDYTAGAEQGPIGVDTFEIAEPEVRVKVFGIVLDESELRPAHTVEPRFLRRGQRAGIGCRGSPMVRVGESCRAGEGKGASGEGGIADKVSSVHVAGNENKRYKKKREQAAHLSPPNSFINALICWLVFSILSL